MPLSLLAAEGRLHLHHDRPATHETVLTVADQGRGMPAEQRARAFDRCWRDAGEVGDDGFGLGLPIVQRRVLASGGRVELTEAPGVGLLVVITLRSAAPTPPDDARGRRHNARTRIPGGESDG